MEIIRICAWCGRRLEGGTNTPIGKPVENHSHIGNVSHGFCDACKAKIEKEMGGCKIKHKKTRQDQGDRGGPVVTTYQKALHL
jgi:hypothetical protein